MKMQNKSVEDSKKILEINPNHSMIKKLSKSLDKLNHKKVSNLLLDNAYILDGNIVKNPSEFIENLTEIFVK